MRKVTVKAVHFTWEICPWYIWRNLYLLFRVKKGGQRQKEQFSLLTSSLTRLTEPPHPAPLVWFICAGIKNAPDNSRQKTMNTSSWAHLLTSLPRCYDCKRMPVFPSWKTIPGTNAGGVQSTMGLQYHPEHCSANAIIFSSSHHISACHSMRYPCASLFPLAALQVSLSSFFTSFHIPLPLIFNSFSPYPLVFPLLLCFAWMLQASATLFISSF